MATALLLLLAEALLLLLPDDGSLLAADGVEERLEVKVEILRVDSHVPVQKEEELLLHQVDLGD